MEHTIKNAFESMVQEIENSITLDHQPHRYHQTSVLSEINSVYHFVKYFDRLYFPECAVYLEYPCDSGRVDGIVVLPNDLILIEAKSEMEVKKFHEINAQAIRFENTGETSSDFEVVNQHMKRYAADTSLRRYLKNNIPRYIREKWGIESSGLNIWGVLLAETTNADNHRRWLDEDGLFLNDSQHALNVLESYSRSSIQNNVYQSKPWWHLLGYKKIGIL